MFFSCQKYFFWISGERCHKSCQFDTWFYFITSFQIRKRVNLLPLQSALSWLFAPKFKFYLENLSWNHFQFQFEFNPQIYWNWIWIFCLLKKIEPSHDILTQKVQNLKSFTDSIHWTSISRPHFFAFCRIICHCLRNNWVKLCFMLCNFTSKFK